MIISQYKNIVKRLTYLSQNNCTLSRNYSYHNQRNINNAYSLISPLIVKNYFSQKKKTPNEEKSIKINLQQKKNVQQSQFIWKLNAFLNVCGIGVGFYFPFQALDFIFAINMMIQIYQSSRLMKKFKNLTQKSPNYDAKKMSDSIIQIKSIYNKGIFRIKLVIINWIIGMLSAISLGVATFYPQFKDYTLIGLNFWTFFNIKFNIIPQGYYFVLLSLLGFQFFYFQNKFDQNKKIKPSQNI